MNCSKVENKIIYEVKCQCGEEKIVEASIHDGPGKHTCDKCGEVMHQDYSKVSFRIPEHMQAGSDAVSPTEIGNRMNRTRPSGKRRSLHAVGGL